MSNLSTPTQYGRGLLVPGIDTKSPFNDPSTALSYGGLHTPPQSAHESRRPSLQYAMEAPYSATSSSFAYSHPSTPVHGLSEGADSLAGLTEAVRARVGMGFNARATPFSNYEQVPLQQPFDASNVGDANYCLVGQSNDADLLGLDMSLTVATPHTWQTPQAHMLADCGSTSTCLGPALFAPDHVQSTSQMSATGTCGSVFYDDGDYTQPHASMQMYGNGTAYQPTPQVVVPSQLSPQDDYAVHQLQEYSPVHQQESGSIVCSFESSSSGYLGYEMMDPPSPTEAYFAHSEDDDYLMVKSERSASPSYGRPPYRNSVGHSRQRGKASKRLRHGAKTGLSHSYVSHELGCTVSYEGKGISVDRDGRIKLEIATSKKPHECLHINPDGKRCGARFERSEHLKRHAGKHSPDRNYPCPLEGCGKKIQRPDNAGDHFKTHLRPKTKGKRNEHFDYPQVEHAILTHYEDHKKAKKLIDGLRRWMEAGMPETSSTRGGHGM